MAGHAEQPTTIDPPEDTPSARKQRIITAANQLFAEGGLEGLTIRAVLKRTGLARRAFYERFAGKDDLVVAVFEETMAQTGAFFDDQIKGIFDPVEKIRVIVVGLVVGALHNEEEPGIRHASAIVREHMRLAQTRPAELENALRPLLRTIADPIREGIRTGQLRQCDPDLQARLIYNLIATTIHPELLAEGARARVGEHGRWLAGEIWEFCRRGIVA